MPKKPRSAESKLQELAVKQYHAQRIGHFLKSIDPLENV